MTTPPDRYPTTRQTTCTACGWKFSQTPWRGTMQPEACPNCDMPAAQEVAPPPKPKPDTSFDDWCNTPEGERCRTGQAYGPYLLQRLHAAYQAGRRA